MAKTKKSETMTVERFKALYGGGEPETRELAEAAMKVPELAELAGELLHVLNRFDAALESIGFGDDE